MVYTSVRRLNLVINQVIVITHKVFLKLFVSYYCTTKRRQNNCCKRVTSSNVISYVQKLYKNIERWTAAVTRKNYLGLVDHRLSPSSIAFSINNVVSIARPHTTSTCPLSGMATSSTFEKLLLISSASRNWMDESFSPWMTRIECPNSCSFWSAGITACVPANKVLCVMCHAASW